MINNYRCNLLNENIITNVVSHDQMDAARIFLKHYTQMTGGTLNSKIKQFTVVVKEDKTNETHHVVMSAELTLHFRPVSATLVRE